MNRGGYGFSSSGDARGVYEKLILNTPSLVGYFPLGEPSYATKVQDALTKRYSTALSNRTLGNPPIRRGSKGCMYCDGASVRTLLPVCASLAYAWTVEFWIKTTTTGNSIFVIRNRSTSWNTTGHSMSVVIGTNPVSGGINGGIAMGADTDGVWNGAWSSAKVINDGKPHHILTTWAQDSGNVDASYIDVFVDGVKVAVGTTKYSSFAVPLIGVGITSVGDAFAGYLSDLAFYQEKFTLDKAIQHFNAGA